MIILRLGLLILLLLVLFALILLNIIVRLVMLLDFVNLAIRLEMVLTPHGILEDIMLDKVRDSVYLHVEVTISTSPTSVFNALLLASDVQIVLPQVAVVVSQDMYFTIYNA